MNEDLKVKVGLGKTINIGDFESMRVDISIEDSARPDETVGQAFDRVYNAVEKRIGEKVVEIETLFKK